MVSLKKEKKYRCVHIHYRGFSYPQQHLTFLLQHILRRKKYTQKCSTLFFSGITLTLGVLSPTYVVSEG